MVAKYWYSQPLSLSGVPCTQSNLIYFLDSLAFYGSTESQNKALCSLAQYLHGKRQSSAAQYSTHLPQPQPSPDPAPAPRLAALKISRRRRPKAPEASETPGLSASAS